VAEYHFGPKRARHSAFRATEGRLSCENFRPFEEDVNKMVERDRQEISASALHAYQNDPMIEAGIGYHVDATVGSGHRWRLCPEPDVAGMDSADRAELIKRIKKLWRKHTGSHRYWIDGEGKKTHNQLVRLFTKTYLWRGEAAATIQRRTIPENRPFATAINIITPGRIRDDERMSDREKTERRIVGGIEHTPNGYPAGYFIHRSSDNSIIQRSNERPSYVRRRDEFGRDQVIHVHRAHLPELARGVSQLVACLRTLRCLDKYSDKTLEAAILQTLLAVTIETDYENSAQQLFAGEEQEPVSGSMALMGESAEFHKTMRAKYGDKYLSFGDNVRAGHLWANEKLNMTSPNMPTQQYGAYVSKLQQGLARCFGHTYATWTQDWTATNYSGARAGFIGINRVVENIAADCAEPFSCAVYNAWLEDVITSGELQVPNMDTITATLSFYTDRESWACCRFRGPAKEEIDKQKQAAAFKTEKELGVLTAERYCDVVLAEDWRDVIDQQLTEECYWNEQRAEKGLPAAPMPSLINENAPGQIIDNNDE
jgi:lambda family phage portal protein